MLSAVRRLAQQFDIASDRGTDTDADGTGTTVGWDTDSGIGWDTTTDTGWELDAGLSADPGGDPGVGWGTEAGWEPDTGAGWGTDADPGRWDSWARTGESGTDLPPVSSGGRSGAGTDAGGDLGAGWDADPGVGWEPDAGAGLPPVASGGRSSAGTDAGSDLGAGWDADPGVGRRGSRARAGERRGQRGIQRADEEQERSRGAQEQARGARDDARGGQARSGAQERPRGAWEQASGGPEHADSAQRAYGAQRRARGAQQWGRGADERWAREPERGRERQEQQPQRDEHELAREICLKQLAVRPRTRAELAKALHKRGISGEVADAVLNRYDEVGMIDDAAFAKAWVSSRHHGRGLASRALAQELKQRGVSQEHTDEALSGLDADTEAETALALATRKLRTMRGEPESVFRRLVGMLARKGYPAGVAVRAVKEALATRDAEVAELIDPDAYEDE